MTKRHFARPFGALAAVSILALTAACSQDAADTETTAASPAATAPESAAEDAGPTAADAADFIAEVEKWTREFGEYYSRVAWVQATYINYDTNWLVTKADTEATEKGVEFANEAKRFNDLDLPAETRRKLEAIKLGVNLPAPSRPGAAAELAEINTRMGAAYETGKIELDGKTVPRSDLEVMMGEIRDPAKLQEIWTKWREVPVTTDADGNTIKSDYAKMVRLANEGARELGYADAGAMWRSRYDMDPDAFAAEMDRLWGQVKPLYDELHCYVRAELNEQYGDEVVPLDQPIRADLLGNMWAQTWGGLNDLAAPEGASPSYDLTDQLVAKGYDAEQIVKTGEGFFSSLGFEPLPETFWERSMITKPADREVACHASAWDLDWADDIRIKMCTSVNADDFRTVHHELGHNYYQRAYQDKSVLFQTGANGGFHEAIGDMISLSITPEYLKEIGLIDEVPDASKDLGLLMNEAMEGVAFLPFGLLMDKWRWQVFSGELTPETYNEGWWNLREEYQGIRPPVERGANYFDPGGKYHIPGNVSYERYFLARVLQFQFHKAACDIAGWEGPLHRCSVYGSKAVGARFNAMLEMGASEPWPEALAAFTGSREMDGSAMVAYFQPLLDWLQEQNEGRSCGW
ncbi:M2 family metallopeptidase [Hyphococcus sp.]|uniref:M2 family metallopeptidase n=1 Tax=Hyphococcus sp. TaxID=2038636 RepID=UPI0035C74A3F